MITIENINLKNIVTYKDQTFSFKPGLSIVKGENRAGKSLMFSSLPNLLYFSHPLADKRDAKAILTSRATEEGKAEGSHILLTVSKEEGRHQYTIKQKASKETVTYQIRENEVDLDSRTIALSKQLIEDIFPQPEDIFYTSTYLTSYRNHPLLHGSTAQRYEFFEKLFNFDLFDYLYDKFNAELKDMEAKKVELANLDSLLLELPTKELELVTANTSLQGLQDRRDVLQNNLSALTQLRFEVIRLLDMRDDLERTQNSLRNLETNNADMLQQYRDVEDYTNLLLEKEAQYKALLESEQGSRFIKAKEDELSQSKSSLETLNYNLASYAAIQELVEGKTVSALRDVNSSLSRDIVEARGQISTLTTVFQNKSLEDWQRAHSKAEELILNTATALALTSEDLAGLTAENLESRISAIQQELAAANFAIAENTSKLAKLTSLSSKHNHDTTTEAKCPTCFGDLNVQQIADFCTSLQEDVATAKNNLLRLTADLDTYNRYLKCKAFLAASPTVASLRVVQSQVLEQQTTITEREQTIKMLSSYVTLLQDKENQDRQIALLEQQILEASASMKTGATVETSSVVRQLIEVLKSYRKAKEDSTHSIARVEAKIEELYALVNNLSTLQTIPTMQVTKENLGDILPKVRDYLEQEISKHTTENTSMQSAITSNSVTASLLRKELAQLEQYKTKTVQLKLDCSQYEVTAKLAKVFHAKGFRLEKIKYFTQVFESTLNRYAGFLFMEPFSFHISVEKRDLQIIATRAGKSSDVRYLSGSESRCFQLLCLISILSLLPSNKKANICVLDEMDAGCDESTTQMFYESFLPELRNIVPSITVITPLKDSGYYINEDFSYMVKKINGVSTILELIK